MKPKRLSSELQAKLALLETYPMTPYQQTMYLEFMRSLPQLNKAATVLYNRNGIAIEVVGLKGTVKRIGVDKHNGVFYFDGNRIGKRKLALVNLMFGVGEGVNGHAPYKVFNKIKKQARV